MGYINSVVNTIFGDQHLCPAQHRCVTHLYFTANGCKSLVYLEIQLLFNKGMKRNSNRKNIEKTDREEINNADISEVVQTYSLFSVEKKLGTIIN